MTRIGLPPKRFDDPWDPRFDNVRGKFWFRKLEVRRKQLPFLKEALAAMHDPSIPITQKDAAKAFGVDERELRDYENFVNGKSKPPDKTFQKVLDDAYLEYCASKAGNDISFFIHRMAKLYGANGRAVNERWEVDPSFLPS